MAVSKTLIFGIIIVIVGAGIGLGVYFGANSDEEVTTVPLTTDSPVTTEIIITESPPRPTVPITPRTPETSKYPWTPLDEYVWTEDPIFSWNILPGYPITVSDPDGDYLHYTLNVTTQTWQNASLFSKTDCSRNDYVGPCDCSIWWHYVSIAVPLTYIEKLKSGETNLLEDSAFMLIGSGSYRDAPRAPDSDQPNYTAKVALATVRSKICVRRRNLVNFQILVKNSEIIE